MHEEQQEEQPLAQRSRDGRRAPGVLGACLFWIALWCVASLILDSDLLLPGPLAVATRLAHEATEPAFWLRIGFSLLRIALGWVLGWVIGTMGAIGAARFGCVRALLEPLVELARSVPVASITILALIWLSAANLSVLVVVLVAAPLVYEALYQALKALDPAQDEMAAVLRISRMRRIRLIVVPQTAPAVHAALRTSLGMAWKAGVAAEVIGIPFGSIGEALYLTKVHFDTEGLFAWTAAVVALSAASEHLARSVIDRALSRFMLDARVPVTTRADGKMLDPAAKGVVDLAGDPPGAATVTLKGVTKTYPGGSGPMDVSFTARAGSPLALIAPSGYGKTTLLRIIAGTVAPDAGTCRIEDTVAEPLDHPRISIAFQDVRLCPHASVLENARIGLPRTRATARLARSLLEDLGLGDRVDRAARTCSGGEQRRIALARALLCPHDVLLLDEPFNGLDPATRIKAAEVIRAHERGMVPIILVTHDPAEGCLLDARPCHLVIRPANAAGRPALDGAKRPDEEG